jgi:hypothetical protein
MFGPVWVEHVDGTLEASAWYALADHARHTLSRAYHAGCLVPDFVPAWMRPHDEAGESASSQLVACVHRHFRMSATRATAATRLATATLALACAAVTALDAASVALHSALT